MATLTTGDAPMVDSSAADPKWPGWPGLNVFRIIVPVSKVGSIIGRKGELIKKICDDTRARVRILDGPLGVPDRIVLISAKEELEAAVPPAIDAAIRVFKRLNNLSETDGSGALPAAVSAVCSVKLLVASSQAINLIGKQGSSVKSIQEQSGSVIKIISDDLPQLASSDERVVEIQGEPLKVLKAFEAVLAHLRKFLVDQGVLPLFEKSSTTAPAEDNAAASWADRNQTLMQTAQKSATNNDYPLSLSQESLLLDHGPRIDSQFPLDRLSLYGQDPAISSLRTAGLTRPTSALVTQITQKMQIPLTYAEEIIGIGGANIAYIRRSSGAVITLKESRTVPNEIVVEIKGSSAQVHSAERLIEEFIVGQKAPAARSYDNIGAGYRSSYSSLAGTTRYLPSSTETLSGYGSGLEGYSRYRL